MVKICLMDSTVAIGQIDALKRNLPHGWELTNLVEGASAIVTENLNITESDIRKAGFSLKCIIRSLPGNAKIAETNIPIFQVLNTGVSSVAEHAMLLMLALGRKLLYAVEETKNQRWVPEKSTPIFTDQKHYIYNWIGIQESGQLHGKVVGIVGFGFIGQDLAARLYAFHVRIIYYDVIRAPQEIEEQYHAKYVSLEELLKQADFVSLHLRFIEGENGNEKMFGVREFKLMKSSAYFINTSRGRVVDEDALADAIKEGGIAGAGLDVFRYEPVKPDCPLLPLIGSNLIMTPHIAGTFMNEAWDTEAKEIFGVIESCL